MKPRAFAYVTALMLAGGLALGNAGCARKQAPRFDSVAVSRGNVVARVTATGTLSALVTVQVGSQVSGRLQQINVDFNSPVKKGQVIAKIDPQLFSAAVEQAKANVAVQMGQVEQAKVNARNLELQRTRSRQLRAQNLIAQQDLDTAETAADAAKANIEVQEAQLAQAKANLHQATVNLDYTTIVSPTDGTVISRSVDVGQTVAASLQAPTLFTIAQDLTKMQVDTSVAEADVGKLTPQMPAMFTVDAYPNERFHGTVRQIRNAPQTVQSVVTYDAVIDVDNKELKLKPGMTANVTFVYAERNDVLKVPNAALRFRPPAEMLSPSSAGSSGTAQAAVPPPGASQERHGRRGEHGPSDQRQVWVLKGGQPAPVSIKIGVSDGSVTEVVAGDLHEGDQVLTDVLGSSGAATGRPGGPPRGGPFGRF